MDRVVDHRRILLFLWLLPLAASGQAILDRPVRVDAERVRLSEALASIAREGDFKLSYNAAAVNGDSVVSVSMEGTVRTALRSVVGPRFELKETGSHIILLDRSGARDRFTITGMIHDAASGDPVVQASVHEVDGRNVASTDASGKFALDVSGERERTAVLVMRKEYHDTVVYVGRGAAMGRLPLRKRAVVEHVEPICLHDRCAVEDLGVARLLVPGDQLDRTANLDIEERSPWQISLIPNVSTNGDISGLVVNAFSLNVLAGYSRGLSGFEVGGVANIESRDVNGAQIAGFTNLVGRNTTGVQIAGAINHTMRTLEGVQVAGLGNTVWDTLSGVQVAGGANVVKGGLRGMQIAGACNVATQNVDGTQIAGAVNVTPRDVRKTQIAGAVNYARSVSGAQVALGVNVASDSVGGGQVGLAANYAGSVTGGQFSLGANIVPGRVNAGQVGFGINYAGSVTGGQFSFGVNVVPGMVEGGQVGALNIARRVKGGQLGFINFSDSLEGAAVGLLTISLKGYHRADLVTGDVMAMSLHIRTGTRGFHNILGYSPPVTPDQRWGFLYGFGTEARIGPRGSLNIDLTGEQVVEQAEWVDAVNVLGRFSVRYGFRVNGPFVFSAGPVLNVLVTDWRDPDTGGYLSALPPDTPPMQWRSGATVIHGWFGWMAAAGVRF